MQFCPHRLRVRAEQWVRPGEGGGTSSTRSPSEACPAALQLGTLGVTLLS